MMRVLIVHSLILLYVILVLPSTYGYRFKNLDKIVTLINTRQDVSWTAEHPSPSSSSQSSSSSSSSSYTTKITQCTQTATEQSWAQSSVLRPVDNQGVCGSCVAFSTTHAWNDVSSLMRNKRTRELAPRALIQCCTDRGCNGCGGNAANAALGFYQNTGIQYEDEFPYSGLRSAWSSDGWDRKQCSSGSHARLYGFVCKTGTEDEMANHIQKYGPIVISIETYEDFDTYPSNPSHTATAPMDIYHHVTGNKVGGHSMEAVGYGTDCTGAKYFVLKNSWGTERGDKGFYYFRRGANECGIQSRGYCYPRFAPKSAFAHATKLQDNREALIQTVPPSPAADNNDTNVFSDDMKPLPVNPYQDEAAMEVAQFAAKEVNGRYCDGPGELVAVADMMVQRVAGRRYEMAIVVGGSHCTKEESFFCDVYFNVSSGNLTLLTYTAFLTTPNVRKMSDQLKHEADNNNTPSAGSSTLLAALIVTGIAFVMLVTVGIERWKRGKERQRQSDHDEPDDDGESNSRREVDSRGEYVAMVDVGSN